MQVTAVSGNTIAQLDEDELLYMVESGQSVRDLKRRLSAQVGCSRFQQRLFSDELGELEDDLALRTLSSVQLVILPLCAPDETMEEELLTSCQENNVAQIARLLQKPLDPNGQGLVLAAQEGHLAVVRLLLEAGADKDAADTDGDTALHIAAKEGHLEVVRLLLEAGADKDAADTDVVIRLCTLQPGRATWKLSDCCSRLELTKMQQRHMDQGLCTLQPRKATWQFVRLLLEAGADKDAADTDGDTALNHAAHYGHLEVVRLLLQAGDTALHIAARDGNLEAIRWLLELTKMQQRHLDQGQMGNIRHEGPMLQLRRRNLQAACTLPEDSA